MDSPRRRAGSSATLVLMALASLAFGCSESEVPSLGDSGSASQRLSEAKPPNLLVVLYDDLDLIGDLGPFGGDPAEVQTPFSDLLAETGRRFDHFYVNAPVCSPTRMALLTGHYPTRYGFTWATEETSRRGLPTVTPTLPRLLKERGYLTGAFGKWHIGSSQDALLPQGVGFDRAAINCTFTNFGRSPANPDPADAAIGYREARFCDRPGRPLADSGRSFATTYTVDKALELITEALDATPGEPPGPGARPFYAQVWLHAPHTPLTCPPGAVDCPTCDPEEDCDARQKRRIHHAMISHAESQLLRLHRDLKARGVWGETLVILASDNGGVGGWHEPSTDLRGAKGSLYERGLRTPLLVAGPGVEVGLVDDVVTGVDLLPTLVELLGLSADSTPSAVQPARSAQPTRASGPAFAGRSFAALLRSDPATAPQLDRVGEAYFWELRPRAAPDRHTLAGRWLQLAVQRRLDGRRYKLVKTDLYAGGDEPQLFDLDADPAESRDLGAERPAVRRYLHDLWRAWRLETATHRPTLLRDGALCADGPLLFVGDSPVTVVDHPALTIGRLDFSVTFQLTVGRQPGSSSWIVGRDGVWSLGLENSRIVLEFAGNRPHRLVHPRVLQTGETVRVAASIMNRRGLSIAVDDRVARARVRFGALPESDAPIQLGLAPDGGESFVGEVDDLLFFPIALGAEDLSLQGLGRSAFVDGMTPVITLPGEARTHAVEVQARFAARVGSGRGSRGAAADGEGDADGGGGFLPFQLEIHCLRGGQVDWHPRARSVEARLAGPEDLIHRVRHLCPAGSEGLRLALTDGGAGALGELETGDLETGAVELGRLGRALLDAGFEADEPIVGRPGPDLDASAKTGSHALRLAPGTTTPTLTLDTRGARALDVSLWARTDPGTVATLSLELSCLDAEGHALRTETGTGPEKRSALTSPGRVDGEWRRFRLLTSCPDGPLTRSVGLRLHTAGEGSVLVDDLAVVVP